jgi:glycosyltransferase involved in cell wall biosynthesis
MSKPLSVLTPVGYSPRFNSPRRSRHRVSARHFLPFNYISPKTEGITVFNPWPPTKFHLIHAFNRIPISGLPFLISFERDLPRGLGIEGSAFLRVMTKHLASDKCRAIIAISEYARRMFLAVHDSSPYYEAFHQKLHLRRPNIPIEPAEDAFGGLSREPIRLAFIGNHFGRKGGCVALRIAELAIEKHYPVVVDVVSKFQIDSWVDPIDASYFDRYRKLLELPNVHYHRSLPNKAVIDLLKKAHFEILATFSDTFGYSAIEAMSNFTPVIATPVGALPEFISDGENGICLDFSTNALGEWIHHEANRSTAAFAALHRDEVERLARSALHRIVELTAKPEKYSAMRRSARSTAVEFFAADDATRYWDELYEQAVCGIVPPAGSIRIR